MKRPIWKPEALSGRPGFIAAGLGGEGAVRRFSRNECGRDFVVGDIHGMFGLLETFLQSLEFDSGQDRLFAVGDLADRGPEPGLALEWIRDRSWFHSVRGNHDQFLLDVAAGANGEEMDLWGYNGGDWWAGVPEGERGAFVEAFASLPFAIEIDCKEGVTGVVHADIPEDLDWSGFCGALCAGSRADSYHAIWSRRRWSEFLRHGSADRVPLVTGLEHVICGHTPVDEPARFGNLWNIDTGAVYAGRLPDARLTIIRIHPGPLELFEHRSPEG